MRVGRDPAPRPEEGPLAAIATSPTLAEGQPQTPSSLAEWNPPAKDMRPPGGGKPFNFASADAGARVLAASRAVVGAKNVIQDSVDRYLLTPCTSGFEQARWIEIELSEDVILDTVEVGNFEFYSSSARNVVVLGAGTYPPAQWNVLGVFGYTDVRTLQSFRIQKRVVTRYLRIMFVGKQGQEYYCPVSTIRALGKNLIADWKTVFEKESKVVKPPPVVEAHTAAAPDKASEATPERRENMPASSSELNERAGRSAEEDRPIHDSQMGSEHHRRPERPDGEREEYGPGSRESPSPTGSEEKQPGSNQQVDESTSGERNDINADAQGSTMPSGGTVTNEVKEVRDVEGGAKSSSNSANPGTKEEKTYEFSGEPMSEEDQIVLEAVQADALSSGGGDDNIFRKVTRLIRILELNQTLTNQYIDTHLSRFAKALKAVQAESAKSQQLTERADQRFLHLMATNKQMAKDFRAYSMKRDVLLCILIICVAFLLGTHWVLWTAVGGTRLHGMENAVPETLPETFSSETDMDVHMRPNSILRAPTHDYGRAPCKDLYHTMSLDSTSHRQTYAPADRPRSISSTEISTMSPRPSNSQP